MIPTIAGLREAVAAARSRSDAVRVAFVPTMGALHEGHLRLVGRAREVADVVVVSIFVNPLQFGPSEDLDRYPRTLEADLAALDGAGADLVFAPTAAEMYPAGPPAVRVTEGAVANSFEGASRPGHFDGVLTVVAKLLNIVQPDVAVFGRKDAQQVFLVRRMVADLDMSVVIDAVDTVREPDGLARSSRNRMLTPDDRRVARVIPAALRAARAHAASGLESALEAAHAELATEPGLGLDYLEAVDPLTFLPVGPDHRGRAQLLLAARVGAVRLIDNDDLDLP